MALPVGVGVLTWGGRCPEPSMEGTLDESHEHQSEFYYPPKGTRLVRS